MIQLLTRWPWGYTPDLDVEFANGLKLFVEVTQFSSGAPEFSAGLHEVATAMSLRLTYHLGLKLSASPVGHRARKRARARANQSLKALTLELRQVRARGIDRGSIHIFITPHKLACVVDTASDLRHGLNEQLERCPLRLATIEFEQSSDEHLGGGATTAHLLDDDTHKQNFLYKLREKAKKSSKLLEEKREGRGFVVAVQNDETWFRPHFARAALTGARLAPTRLPSSVGFRPRERHAEEFSAADQAGWTPLLNALHYGLHASVRFTDESDSLQNPRTIWSCALDARFVPRELGAYWSFRWAKLLSAVLVVHRSECVQWLPNPWARKDRNDVRLLSIGMPENPDGEPF